MSWECRPCLVTDWECGGQPVFRKSVILFSLLLAGCQTQFTQKLCPTPKWRRSETLGGGATGIRGFAIINHKRYLLCVISQQVTIHWHFLFLFDLLHVTLHTKGQKTSIGYKDARLLFFSSLIPSYEWESRVPKALGWLALMWRLAGIGQNHGQAVDSLLADSCNALPSLAVLNSCLQLRGILCRHLAGKVMVIDESHMRYSWYL